eukprot:364711-Chlamydomonas_euryale.AAC.3
MWFDKKQGDGLIRRVLQATTKDPRTFKSLVRRRTFWGTVVPPSGGRGEGEATAEGAFKTFSELVARFGVEPYHLCPAFRADPCACVSQAAYRVSVWTSNVSGAGTDSNVFIQVCVHPRLPSHPGVCTHGCLVIQVCAPTLA